MEKMNPGLNHGTIAAGPGKLITINGSIKTTTTVSTPIVLGDGNHVLRDNEAGAVITAGNGNNRITELGAGAKISLGNGYNSVTDPTGGAVVSTGTGDVFINLGGIGNTITVGPTEGGKHDVSFINTGSGTATVMAGDGNMVINAGGANNTITAGTGHDVINLGRPAWEIFEHHKGTTTPTIPITADTVHLGNGTNMVFMGGSGNTIYDGTGSDTIVGLAGAANRIVLNAAGGTDTISGFNLTTGATLDLSAILGGIPADLLTNTAAYLTLTSSAEAHHPAKIDNVLKVTGLGGTATVTLLNSGSLSLSGLLASSHVIQ